MKKFVAAVGLVAAASCWQPAAAGQAQTCALLAAVGIPCVVDAKNTPIGVAYPGNILWRRLGGKVYSLQYNSVMGLLYNLILVYADPACNSQPYIEDGTFVGAGPDGAHINSIDPRPAAYDAAHNQVWGASGDFTLIQKQSFFYSNICTAGTWGGADPGRWAAVRAATVLETPTYQSNRPWQQP